MSLEADTVSTDEQKTRAKEMGWHDGPEFKGNPEHWRPAAEFVQRGEEILPIVREENKSLRRELKEAKDRLDRADGLIRDSQQAIEDLKAFHSEATAQAVERAKAELRKSIKEAREAGNEDLAEELREQLSEVKTAEKTAGTKEKTPPPSQPAQDPQFITWHSENPWYGVDLNKTALMHAQAQMLRADPANEGLKGRAFYEKAAAMADQILNPPARRSSKMEEGDGGGAGARGGLRKRSYNDLPAEARTECDRQGQKLVGKAFKTAAEWQQYYANIYFEGEAA
jgi:hypothetical protein